MNTAAIFVAFVCLGITGWDAHAKTVRQCENSTPTYRVATWNVLTKHVAPTLVFPPWEIRLPTIVDWIQATNLDIIAVQELLPEMAVDLKRQLPNYLFVGTPRSRNPQTGEYSALFVNPRRFAVIDSGTFWLSPNSEVPESRGWDAAIERICTWAMLRDLVNGQTLFAFGTHFDHLGKIARARSALLIRNKIAILAGEAPAILLGDFNIEERDPALAVLYDRFHYARDRSLQLPLGGPGTFVNGRRIDHIFTDRRQTVHSYEIASPRTLSGRLPSDHYPVWIELETRLDRSSAL